MLLGINSIRFSKFSHHKRFNLLVGQLVSLINSERRLQNLEKQIMRNLEAALMHAKLSSTEERRKDRA
jgi:hypothetical protein